MSVVDELLKMWDAKPTEKSTEKSVQKSTRNSARKAERKSTAKSKAQEKNVLSKTFMKTIEGIQKSAEKHGIDKACATFFEGKFLYVLDGHRILKSKQKFIKAGKNVGGFDVDNIFGDVHNRITEKITSPTYAELSEMVNKTRKDAGKRKPTRVLYQFKNGLTVDADYLLDALSITDNTEFSFTDKTHPMIFESKDKNYEVLVCPVNSAEKFHGCKVA